MIGKLINKHKKCFSQIKEHRYKKKQKSLVSYLITSFAMFQLKNPLLRPISSFTTN